MRKSRTSGSIEGLASQGASLLDKNYVIFITTYEFFGKGRYINTFETAAARKQTSLGDDATKIVLNTKVSVGKISDELKMLLRFMDGMEPDSNYTRDLDKAVTEVKADEEWRRAFVVLIERDMKKRRLGGRRTRMTQT